MVTITPQPIPNPELPVAVRPSLSTPTLGGTFVDTTDGAATITIDEPHRARAFVPRVFTKTDTSSNALTITDGVLFSITLSNVGDSVSIVSDGKNYASTFTPGSVATVVVPDGDYGDLVITGGAWAIDTAYTAARDAYADGVAAAAAAASLPLHGTADDSAKLGGVTPSAYGLTLIDDVDAPTARGTLGLGTLATQSGTFSGTSSGTNTGDQTITLTGDVTGTGTGSFAATIGNSKVTLAKMADLAQDQFIGRTTGSTGVPETATITAAARTVLDDTTVEAMCTTLGGGARQGSGVLVGATSPTLTTPVIGAATGTSLAVSGAVTSSGAAAGVGYAAGAGTSVTQGSGSGKATAVTLNTMCGEITMNNASLSAGAEVSFTVNCTSVRIQDVILVCHQSAGTFGAYSIEAGSITNATSFKIMVSNLQAAGSLSEAIVLNFVIIRGVKT